MSGDGRAGCRTASRRTSSSIVESVLAGEAYLAELDSPQEMREVARAVHDAATASGPASITAASRRSEALVGATLLLGGDDISRTDMSRLQDDHTRVFVVEAVAVSGHHVRQTVSQLRDAGARWVGVIVAQDMSNVHANLGGQASELERFGAPDSVMIIDHARSDRAANAAVAASS